MVDYGPESKLFFAGTFSSNLFIERSMKPEVYLEKLLRGQICAFYLLFRRKTIKKYLEKCIDG